MTNITLARLMERHAASSPSTAAMLPGEGEDRVVRLLESITDGFCALDRDWRFTFINEAAKRLLAASVGDPSELLGRSHWDAFPETRGTSLEREYRRAVTEHVPVEIEWFHPGWSRWFSIRAFPIDGDGLSVYFRDTTEQRRATEALRESEAKYRAVFNSIDEGLCLIEVVWDAEDRPVDYRFLEVNRAFETQTGLQNAIGRTVRELNPAHEHFWFETYGRVARTGKATRFIQESRTLKRWFDVYAFAIPSSGDSHVAVLSNDITERRQREEAVREAKAQLEAASRAKDDFLAALSHELRTPLTPVLMAAEDLCHDAALPPETHATLCMMRHNIALEARLIDDLLDLTRIAKGKLALREQECEAHSLIALALEIVRDEAQTKGIELSVELSAQRTQFRGDPARLQQVFWNLLTNAVKFTPKGGRISVRSNSEGARLRIQVSDTGAGIASEALDRIFLPFEQSGLDPRHRLGGLGLGLSIAKTIVEMHGGAIRAESEGLGHGTTFSIELEAAERRLGVTADQELQTSSERNATSAATAPLRLLLVEDHEPTLSILSRLLTRAGHSVATATNVATARELGARERFDGVISDIGLPDGTGLELMSGLHTDHGLRGIALSGYGMEEDVRRSREAGFIAHLVKPVDFAQVRRVVEQLAVARS